MSANPHANGGLLLHDLRLPDFRDYGVEVAAPATQTSEATRVLGTWLRDVIRAEPVDVPVVRPGRDRLEPARCRVRGDRPGLDGRDPRDGRAPRPERPRHGGPVRAPLPGLARGLPADRSPRAVQLLRGVHPRHRLDVQPARQVAEDDPRDRLAPADRLAELPADQPRLAPGPQRLLATRTRASSTTSSTSAPRSSASTSRPTRTACCRSPITACAAATTSTSSSPASSRP